MSEKRKIDFNPNNSKWRLYADANLAPSDIDRLRKFRFNVMSVTEEKMNGRDDEYHFKEAYKQKRVLVTRDDDFWDDHPYKLADTRGIIILSKNAGATEVRMFKEIFTPFTMDWKKVKLTNEGFVLKGRSKIFGSIEDKRLWKEWD